MTEIWTVYWQNVAIFMEKKLRKTFFITVTLKMLQMNYNLGLY